MLTNDRPPRLFCLLGAALFLFAPCVTAANEEVELHIKAAYLLNFARFVEWPGLDPDASGAVIIGVLGHDSITATLEATVHGKTINGRPIRIRQFASLEQVDRCDVLFVPRSEAKKSRSRLADLSGRRILTVGDAKGFLGDGGIIEFQVIDDTLRFSINVGSADRSGLKISSELLRVAYSITGRQK